MDLTASQEPRANQMVALPCDAAANGDGGTYSVSIATGGNPVFGTVAATTMEYGGGTAAHVRAVVVKVRRRSVTVWVPGAFENSNGRLTIDRGWFEENALVHDARRPLDPKRRLPFYWGHGWFHDLGVATDRRRRSWRNQSGMRNSSQW